jgi:hypothetical protein
MSKSIIQLSFLDNPRDARPLPLIIASNERFALQHYEPSDSQSDYLYSIQDWIAGVSQTENVRDFWNKLKKRTVDMASTVQKLPYKSSNGRTYQMDFADDETLYRITQRMDTNTGIRNKVLDYLAKAGVKLDEYRINPGQAVDDAIGQYVADGKTDSWAEARVQGIVTRKRFTDALKAAVMDAPVNLYAVGTEKVYQGLWQRTTAQLRGELNLTPKQNPRDSMSEYALVYTRLAEMLATDKLENAETVAMTVASEIIYSAATMIREQALQTATFLGVDAFTGKKLLKG